MKFTVYSYEVFNLLGTDSPVMDEGTLVLLKDYAKRQMHPPHVPSMVDAYVDGLKVAAELMKDGTIVVTLGGE